MLSIWTTLEFCKELNNYAVWGWDSLSYKKTHVNISCGLPHFQHYFSHMMVTYSCISMVLPAQS